MTTGLEFTPVFLATRSSREPARLLSDGERILALLVPVGPEEGEAETEGWYLEVGFGPCEAEGLLFASLDAAETWAHERLTGHAGSAVGKDQPTLDAPEAAPRALRLLIVEDDGLQALELQSLALDLGHTVVGMAATAPKAVAAAEAHRPDLVLMDVRLAESTSGIDAATEIDARFGIPSLFMTAHADVQTRARAAQVRSLELLAKPVSPDALAAALGRAAVRLSGDT